MSTILREESLIEPMVSTTWATTSPPLAAIDEADTASWLAWRALSAFCLTVEVSSSIELAVSSSELACASVRADRSALPEAISRAATVMVSVPLRTWPTVPARLSLMFLSACIRPAISSEPSVSMCAPSSPAATVRATAAASSSGPTIERVISSASTTPSTMPTAPRPNSQVFMVEPGRPPRTTGRTTMAMRTSRMLPKPIARRVPILKSRRFMSRS